MSQISKDVRVEHLREVSIQTCLMLFALAVTLTVVPRENREFPFSSVQQYEEFKLELQKQMMKCSRDKIDKWGRVRIRCDFGGYRPNGPRTNL